MRLLSIDAISESAAYRLEDDAREDDLVIVEVAPGWCELWRWDPTAFIRECRGGGWERVGCGKGEVCADIAERLLAEYS